MTIIFLRTLGGSWLNANMIEFIDDERYAFTENKHRYQLIDNWWHPGNQIILKV